MNISIFSKLSGNTYIELPRRLRNSIRGLINIKNNDNKCFLWCHIRHLNLLNTHLKRITKADKNMVNDLDYEGINFPVSKKDFDKIEKKKKICNNVFCYPDNMVYSVYLSSQKFRNCMNLLLITDEISHIMSMSETLTDLCAIRQNVRLKIFFANIVYNILVVKEFWQNIKKLVWKKMVNRL